MSTRAPRILAFAGSARRDSLNKKLVKVAADAAREAGAEVTLLDLRDFLLPLFDQDLEDTEGMPENAARLKQLMIEHDGFLIASPEYNSSITALLKNLIDWVSRGTGGEKPLIAFQRKVAVLMSASPGGLGGLRGLVHLRSILGNVGVIVLPEQYALSHASQAFDEAGNLKDPAQREKVRALGIALAEFLQRFGGDE